jgi:hypothetical protein
MPTQTVSSIPFPTSTTGHHKWKKFRHGASTSVRACVRVPRSRTEGDGGRRRWRATPKCAANTQTCPLDCKHQGAEASTPRHVNSMICVQLGAGAARGVRPPRHPQPHTAKDPATPVAKAHPPPPHGSKVCYQGFQCVVGGPTPNPSCNRMQNNYAVGIRGVGGQRGALPPSGA